MGRHEHARAFGDDGVEEMGWHKQKVASLCSGSPGSPAFCSELYVHRQGIWRVREGEIKIANLPMMDHEGINQREIRLGMDFGWKRN